MATDRVLREVSLSAPNDVETGLGARLRDRHLRGAAPPPWRACPTARPGSRVDRAGACHGHQPGRPRRGCRRRLGHRRRRALPRRPATLGRTRAGSRLPAKAACSAASRSGPAPCGWRTPRGAPSTASTPRATARPSPSRCRAQPTAWRSARAPSGSRARVSRCSGSIRGGSRGALDRRRGRGERHRGRRRERVGRPRRRANAVARIDPVSGRVAWIRVGDAPTDVCVSPGAVSGSPTAGRERSPASTPPTRPSGGHASEYRAAEPDRDRRPVGVGDLSRPAPPRGLGQRRLLGVDLVRR